MTEANQANKVDHGRDQAVAINLDAIEQVSSLERPTAGDLMRAAAPLRLLFIDDHLQQSAISHGFDLRLNKPPTDFLEDAVPLGNVGFAMGGECMAWGKRVHGFEWDEGAVTYRNKPKSDEPIKIKDFLRQTVLIVRGTKITREQVIRYVANKSGIMHYDRTRGKHNDLALDRARSLFWFTLDNKGEAGQHFDQRNMHRVVEQFAARPLRVDCVLIQNLVAAQLMVASADLQRFRQALDASLATLE